MRKYGLITALTGLVVLTLISFIPVPQTRILSNGIDSFATHRPITAKNILGQTVTLEGQLISLGAIIVPLNHDHQTTAVTVQLVDSQKQTITQTIIPANAIQDDMFAPAQFDHPIGQEGQTITIFFSTPNNTNPTLAALRFDPKPLTRLEAGQVKPGTYAIELHEKVPLWQAIYTTIVSHQDRVTSIAWVVAISLLMSLLAWAITVTASKSNLQKKLKITALIVIAVGGLSSRLIVIQQLGGVSGGDAYNYFDITHSISHLQNPFANTKRLPFYPLLLVPSFVYPHGDPIRTMEIIQTLSAIGILLLLPALATRLKLPWASGLVAATLLASQKDFFATSIRPEPYTIFALLVMCATILYLHRPKPWQQYAFSLCLGLAALTRQEGFMLAALFGTIEIIQLAIQIKKTHQWKQLIGPTLRSFLPALIIVIPFFINNFLSFGNPLFTPYFDGDRLQIVNSWPAFQDNLGATWGVLGSVFKPSWDELTRLEITAPTFLYSLLFVAIWSYLYIFRQKLARSTAYLIIIASLIIAGFSGYAFMATGGLFSSLVTNFTGAVLLGSWIVFLWQTKWPGVIVFTVFISQAGIALWFHPFAKHFQQSLPFLFTMIAAWLTAPVLHSEFFTSKKQHFIAPLAITLLLVPWLLTSITLWQTVGAMIDKQNVSNALDSVVYRAIKVARLQPGPLGSNEDYQQVRTFFTDTASYFTSDTLPTATEETQWLQSNHIKTMIVTTDTKAFNNLPAPWQVIAHFKSEGDDNRLYESFVYQVP